jgi:aspartate kinase
MESEGNLVCGSSELAYFGAKVLHPATVLPAVGQEHSGFHLNSRKPAGTGTRITRDAVPCKNLIKAIAGKTWNYRGNGFVFSNADGARFSSRSFRIFDRHRASVDMIATSEVSVSLSLDNTAKLPMILEELRALGEVKVDENLTLICLVGGNLRYTLASPPKYFGSIRDINVLMVSHGASNINMSFLVDQKRAETAVRKLHSYFFEASTALYFEPPA